MRNATGLTARDLVVRTDFITATDASAVMGTSPFKTKYDIYMEKCVELVPLVPSPAMTWGLLLEPVILQFSQAVLAGLHKRPNLKLTKNGCRRRHNNGVMSATLDARVTGLPEAVEAKTHAAIHGFVDTSAWGEPWTDSIPRWYLDQVLAQLACSPDLERVWVVLSVGRAVPDFYCVDRANHMPRIALIETTCCDFWDQHILPNIPPEDSTPSIEVARRINVPVDPERVVTLEDSLIERREKVSKFKNRLKDMQEDLDATILTRMAGADKAVTPRGHSVGLTTYFCRTHEVKGGNRTRMNVRVRKMLPVV